MRVIAHLHEDGSYTYAADEPVDLILVGEAVSSDRCYRFAQNGPVFKIGREAVDEILGDDPIGHADDGRHPNLVDRIEKFFEEKGIEFPPLSVK